LCSFNIYHYNQQSPEAAEQQQQQPTLFKWRRTTKVDPFNSKLSCIVQLHIKVWATNRQQ